MDAFNVDIQSQSHVGTFNSCLSDAKNCSNLISYDIETVLANTDVKGPGRSAISCMISPAADPGISYRQHSRCGG